MVESEFVYDDFRQFADFMKGHDLSYKFLEITDESIYAYVLGSQRIAYREKSDGKDLQKKIDELKGLGFALGSRRIISV